MTGRRPIGPVDRIWLTMDQPTNLMVIDSILWFDRPVDWDRFTSVVRRRLLARYPVFTQRPVESTLPMGQPHWEDDEGFDLDRHLRRVRLRRPGGEAALRRYVEEQLHRPLERDRPLWELHLIDGYGKGSALMTRFHHALADGMALASVLLSLTDPAADDDLLPDDPDPVTPSNGSSNPVLGVAREALHLIGGLPHLGTLAHLADPHRVTEALTLTRQTAQVANKLLLGSNPQTVLSDPPVVAKRVDWSRPHSLADVKRVAKLAGGTVNDVVVSAVAAAVSSYLVERGAPAVDLTTMVPVNMRPADRPLPRELGNRFALVLLDMPSGTWPPLQRLAETKRRMDAIKASPEATLTFGVITAIGSTTPDIERVIVDFFASKAVGVTTNVAGPTTERFLAGTPIAGMLGWVPGTGGQNLGVCIFTYNQTVRVGFKVDAAAIPDPHLLVRGFDAAVDELLHLAGEVTAGPAS